MANLLIFDETLRDGEQQVGLFFDDKPALAQLIAQTGVHKIAIMPSVHPTEEKLAQQLLAEGLKPQLTTSTLMKQSAIAQAQEYGVKQIILFHAVSDRLLFLRDHEIANDPIFSRQIIDDQIPSEVITAMRERMLQKTLKHLRYAKAQGLKVYFAAEDASRADFNFLVECINRCSPYIENFLLCDTVGKLTPQQTFTWIQNLLASSKSVPLSVHFHNDQGLALENTIQAICAGASGISGTFNGIGERAGNVALEQVLWGLKLRFGWEVSGINYTAVEEVVDYLNARGWHPHPPYSQQAQRHESGIHVHSLLRDRASYQVFPNSHPEIWFGKFSGVSNFQYLFEDYLKQPLERSDYQRLNTAIKTIAIEQKRSFSIEEVIELIHGKNLLGRELIANKPANCRNRHGSW